MKTPLFLAGLSIVLLCCSMAEAQHTHEGDFELKVEFDSIIVDPRVLPGELAADEFFSTDEPGFDSELGAFPLGTTVGFNIRDGLKRWSSSGFERLDPATAETVIVSHVQRVRKSGSGFVAGFDLPVGQDGSWHRHLVFTLSGPGTNDPRRGIYLLELGLYSTSPAVAGSYPIYIVFNVDDEPNHEPALEWVRHNLARPVCIQKPVADLNGDCKVDFQDFALFAESWLSCNLRPESECWQ
ncbi:MAG TPA: hypothetical protein VMW24_04155 [Sedimentisphaerales bacterium]|nr:hypothetical protein [Sedimentisphaerales bacterium]